MAKLINLEKKLCEKKLIGSHFFLFLRIDFGKKPGAFTEVKFLHISHKIFCLTFVNKKQDIKMDTIANGI